MSYYYFAATLPAVFMDKPPILSLERFREQCREYLGADDSRAMEELLSGPEGKSSNVFVTEWRRSERALRNAMARARAERTGRDASKYVRQPDDREPAVESALAGILARDNPAEREKLVDRMRWDRIEEMSGFDQFAACAVFAYGLKLQIAARWAGMNMEEGSARVEDLVSSRPGDRTAE